MSSDAIVRIRDLTKRIGSKTIIDRISLEVYPGEVFGFLGPNGSGKTTTIRMMVGLMSLTNGDIHIGGDSVRTAFSKAVSRVGAIVENPEMYKFLTGYQNLLHFARMSGVPRERIDEVTKLVGLEGRIHDKVKGYSLGMRQRLGVAQAVMHRPKLLVLDEPTNGLDPAGIRELRDYLRKLAREEGTAVFVSSHLLTEMELMCDRVAILQNGKILDIRSLRQEGSDPAAVAAEEVLFEVGRPEEALGVLSSLGAGRVIEGGVLLRADRQTTAAANRKLVEAGIDVFGIRVKAKSLEDQFLEVTGGDRHV